MGSRNGLRTRERPRAAATGGRRMAARRRPAARRGHEADQGRDDLQPEQPDRPRADRGRDGRGREGRRPRRRLDRRRRDLPRRRARHRRRHAHVLRALRQGDRDERALEGVRDAGVARRLGGRAPEDDRPHLGAPRLHDPHPVGGERSSRRVRDAARRARGDPRPHASDRAGQLPAARGVAADPRRHLHLGQARRRRDRLREVRPADQEPRARRAHPDRSGACCSCPATCSA